MWHARSCLYWYLFTAGISFLVLIPVYSSRSLDACGTRAPGDLLLIPVITSKETRVNTHLMTQLRRYWHQ
jgi:hypothetical protein